MVALWAVRTLARTATRIPMKPAAREQTAPRMKPREVAVSRAMKRTPAMMAPMTLMEASWRLR